MALAAFVKVQFYLIIIANFLVLVKTRKICHNNSGIRLMSNNPRIIGAETSLLREKQPEFRRLRFPEECCSKGDTACPYSARVPSGMPPDKIQGREDISRFQGGHKFPGPVTKADKGNDPDGDGDFSQAPNFKFNDGQVKFDANDVSNYNDNYGSASGFRPKSLLTDKRVLSYKRSFA